MSIFAKWAVQFFFIIFPCDDDTFFKCIFFLDWTMAKLLNIPWKLYWTYHGKFDEYSKAILVNMPWQLKVYYIYVPEANFWTCHGNSKAILGSKWCTIGHDVFFLWLILVLLPLAMYMASQLYPPIFSYKLGMTNFMMPFAVVP